MIEIEDDITMISTGESRMPMIATMIITGAGVMEVSTGTTVKEVDISLEITSTIIDQDRNTIMMKTEEESTKTIEEILRTVIITVGIKVEIK